MGIIELIFLIAIIGLLAWAITTYVPMPPPFKGIIIVVLVLFCLLLLYRAVGGSDMNMDLNL